MAVLLTASQACCIVNCAQRIERDLYTVSREEDTPSVRKRDPIERRQNLVKRIHDPAFIQRICRPWHSNACSHNSPVLRLARRNGVASGYCGDFIFYIVHSYTLAYKCRAQTSRKEARAYDGDAAHNNCNSAVRAGGIAGRCCRASCLSRCGIRSDYDGIRHYSR